MIVLLIGIIVIGMSAPMISRQLKNETSNNVQFQVLTQRVERATVPVGVVVMWSGSTVNIPRGWALCDGNNGTPDLRGRFVVGVDNVDYSMGSIGGEKEVALTVEQMPRHQHQVLPYSGLEGAGGYISRNNITASTYANSSNMTMPTGGGAGGNTMSHENRPPYYALAYIMKTR